MTKRYIMNVDFFMEVVMEIRVLRYFLEIARQGSMTSAAKILHISQPALSKQIKDLEDELGQTFFIRGNRSVSLTEEGQILLKRAEEIVELVDNTTDELKNIDDLIGGEIHFVCAESHLMSYMASKFKKFKEKYPLFKYNIISGDRWITYNNLERGLADFGVVVERPRLDRYSYIELPGVDTWGAVMPYDHPLAAKEEIRVSDLYGYDIICSRQSVEEDIPRWCGKRIDKLNFAGYTSLAYNGSVFVQNGLGIMLTFDHLIQPCAENGLVFRPLYPRLENKSYFIWNKYREFSPIAKRFLKEYSCECCHKRHST